jgi:acyl-CoA thioester hydrolase
MASEESNNPSERAALFESYFSVKPEWIDFNGHFNMGYYLVAFDEYATDQYYDYLGLGQAHKQAAAKTTFTLAANIDYIAEAMQGDELRVTSQLVDFDRKRLHYIHCMYHALHGHLIATNECLGMYIDLATRKGSVFDESQLVRFERELLLCQQHPTPARFARKLGIRRPAV